MAEKKDVCHECEGKLLPCIRVVDKEGNHYCSTYPCKVAAVRRKMEEERIKSEQGNPTS